MLPFRLLKETLLSPHIPPQHSHCALSSELSRCLLMFANLEIPLLFLDASDFHTTDCVSHCFSLSQGLFSTGLLLLYPALMLPPSLMMLVIAVAHLSVS